MKKVFALQIANIVALVVTLLLNGLSNTDLFPNTVGDLGESRAVFFLPDGYVFAIWGLIYTGLLAYVTYQALEKFRNGDVEKSDSVVDRIGWWFIVSSVANSVWILLFVYDAVWLSTIVITALLISLIMIYVRLGIGVREVSMTEKWAVHVPFSIYLGWVSVATVANFATALYTSGAVTGLIGIDSAMWATIMMIVAAVLAFAMLYFRRDVAYALVVVWATVGINARPFDTDLYSALSNLNADLVNTTALSIAVAVGIGASIAFLLSLRNRFSSSS
ncbi:MAG: hypothetical protein WBC91_06015, partial [Phototrophicaceae bacterium]